MSPVSEPRPADPTCGLCGAVRPAGAAGLAWVRERDGRGRERRLCPSCARRHVRDIEARLDPEWW